MTSLGETQQMPTVPEERRDPNGCGCLLVMFFFSIALWGVAISRLVKWLWL